MSSSSGSSIGNTFRDCRNELLLTDGTKERRAPRLGNPPNHASAARGWTALPFSVVDTKPIVAANCLGKNLFDRADKAHRAVARSSSARGNRRRLPLGREMRHVQRFGHVDVAQAGD